jgi:hypothetical protein
MPYKVKRIGNKFQVLKKDNNKVMGTHPNKRAAEAQIKAIYASEALK